MKKLIFSLMLTVVTFVFLLVLAPGKSSASFNASNLIDDITFENVNSMSAVQIDSWLNQFPSSCISANNGFTTPDPQGWKVDHYAFGGNVSAGQAIYDVSQLYHVNPQVILSTLQKEQSIPTGSVGCYPNVPDPSATVRTTKTCRAVTTDTPPDQITTTICTNACPYSGGCMNIALGYGCPYYCKAVNEGFSLQLTLGVWLLRFGEQRAYGHLTGYIGYESGDENFCYSGPMTAGVRQRSAVNGGGCTNAAISYDGSYTTVDNTSITVANGASATLYNFTPFVSGNSKFDTIFQNWFGSLYANDSFAPHPNGTLVSFGGRVYGLENNVKRWITTGDVFNSYGLSWSQVKQGTTGDTNLSDGPDYNTLAPGTVFRTNNSPVYIMTSEGGIIKQQQLSYAAFNSLGYSWSEVMLVAPGSIPAPVSSSILTANQHPAGTLISGGGKVYVLDEAFKYWVFGPDAFNTHNYNWNKVKPATVADLALADGSSIDLRPGALFNSGGSIYLVDYDGTGVLKRPVGPWECFANRWHYTSSDLYPIATPPARTGGIATC